MTSDEKKEMSDAAYVWWTKAKVRRKSGCSEVQLLFFTSKFECGLGLGFVGDQHTR